MQDTSDLRKKIQQFLGRCPEHSASFQQIINEFYAVNPMDISAITKAIYELIDEGRAVKFSALFEGEEQNHARLVS